MKIGENIKYLMKVKNLTQSALAKEIGVKQNTISQWITGTNEPSCETILKLCKILDSTPNELLGWED
ncbi:MAG: helix-turn-helix transcriptional regulator [Clostridiales bacterium]|nr:helix-turn-helix transcriptional regulator [Clostridiales bacterium]